MLVANVTNSKVDGCAVRCCGIHHLGHHPGYVDPWFIDLLLYFPMNGWASFALGRRSLGPLRDLTAFAMFPDAFLSRVELFVIWVFVTRADADAVAAVDAGRIGQGDCVLGGDAGVEAAPGHGDGKGVLRLVPACLHALVAKHAFGVVAHIEGVVHLDRLGDTLGLLA